MHIYSSKCKNIYFASRRLGKNLGMGKGGGGERGEHMSTSGLLKQILKQIKKKNQKWGGGGHVPPLTPSVPTALMKVHDFMCMCVCECARVWLLFVC